MPLVRSSLLLFVVALAACGGTRVEDTASLPVDTLIKSLEREPLSEADLAGLSLADLALELPWTTNTVSKGAAEGAPPSPILGAEVSGHDGFDRVVFLFDDTRPLPGYHLALAPAGDTLPCGDGSVRLTAAPSLVVVLRPARSAPEGAPHLPAGMRRTDASRMIRAGVVCEPADTFVWAAELSQGEEVRILELRGPARLAVDVR